MRLGSFLAVIGLVTAVILLVLVWFYPSSADFHADNPFWNGLSDTKGIFRAHVISSLADLPVEPTGTVLIEIPYEGYMPEEGQRLLDYVSNGGTLLLMDDYGYGNEVLFYLGQPFQFSGAPLRDSLFNYKNGRLPRITSFARVAAGTGSIVLNHATTLEAPNDKVLAFSSIFSYLDENGNDALDTNERVGPFAVAAYVHIEKGLLIAVADPSILINSMIMLEDNRGFVANLVSTSGPDSLVFLDGSHLKGDKLDNSKQVLARAQRIVSSPAGIIIISTVAVLIPVALAWRRKGVNFGRP